MQLLKEESESVPREKEGLDLSTPGYVKNDQKSRSRIMMKQEKEMFLTQQHYWKQGASLPDSALKK